MIEEKSINLSGLVEFFVVVLCTARRCYDGTESQRENKTDYKYKNESDSLSINFEEGRSLVM